jgi:hypothetical protein
MTATILLLPPHHPRRGRGDSLMRRPPAAFRRGSAHRRREVALASLAHIMKKALIAKGNSVTTTNPRVRSGGRRRPARARPARHAYQRERPAPRRPRDPRGRAGRAASSGLVVGLAAYAALVPASAAANDPRTPAAGTRRRQPSAQPDSLPPGRGRHDTTPCREEYPDHKGDSTTTTTRAGAPKKAGQQRGRATTSSHAPTSTTSTRRRRRRAGQLR